MAGGKQTPRQKLIGMMYLVLTAMLALNVSSAVLWSFLTINDSIVATNRNFESKIADTYAIFDRALAENREKTQANFDKAQEARRLTAEFRQYVENLRILMIQDAVRGISVDEARVLNPHEIRRQDNYDTPSRIFIEQGRGEELREKIEEYERAMLALLPNEESRKHIKSPFNTTGPFFDANGREVSWERANFFKTIIVAAIAILNKLENDAMNLEFDVVNELFRLVSAGDLTFDNVQARIVPKSTFVALGETFEAEIFLVAFDSRTRITANVNGQILNSRDGVINFTSPTTREGVFPVTGYINLPGGDTYPFRTEYIVARPPATVSADQMNVFYIGVDNPITVAVGGADPTTVRTTISGNGNTVERVAGSANNYIVRVTSPGEVTVTLSVQTGTTSRVAGTSRFRVKRVPDPIAVVVGMDDNATSINRDQFANSAGLLPRMPRDFDFLLPNLRINSFTMTTTIGGDITPFRSNSNRFTDEMFTAIRNSRRGQRFFFEDIMCQMPTGPTQLRSFVLTIQ